MLPHPRKITFKFTMTGNGSPDSNFISRGNETSQEFADVSSSSSSSSDDESSETKMANLVNSWCFMTLQQLMVQLCLSLNPQGLPISNQQPPRVLPSVGAFTVQCASCFKWRLIPTKEKYEEIREHILEQPFYCKTAREWRPDISCDDPADISQDGSRLWAIDKPNIAQSPPGWQRLLRIRGEGSTKFADVYEPFSCFKMMNDDCCWYYDAPSGKRFRSMVEIQKYLSEHPEYATKGVTMSKFSFQIPKPLQENYARKRLARLLAPCNGHGRLEPDLVSPLAWAGPDESPHLQLGMPLLRPPGVSDPINRPAKKRAKGSPSKEMHSNDPKATTVSS